MSGKGLLTSVEKKYPSSTKLILLEGYLYLSLGVVYFIFYPFRQLLPRLVFW